MSNDNFTQLIEMHELDQRIVCKRAIESLSPRLQLIAVRRFYQNQSLLSIAEELGLSQARTWQLEARLLRQLRHGFKSKTM